MAVQTETKPIDNTQICANGKKAEDSCKGDSGGPISEDLIENKTQKTYQVGIVSFAATLTCGNIELPTIYTRIDHYLQWILNNVN